MSEAPIPVDAFCECCGKPTQEIKNELVQVPYDQNGKRQVGKHYQFKSTGCIYDDNTLRNCAGCGAKLNPDDIKTEREFMGMCGSSRAYQDIITGYKCHTCKREVEF